MATTYETAHLNASANAITALGNRIGLYLSTGARVGTVYADTTWGSAAAGSGGDSGKAVATGSTVTITIPASTLANGNVITQYAVFSGTTLLRRVDLPASITVNDATQALQIDVTPVFKYSGT